MAHDDGRPQARSHRRRLFPQKGGSEPDGRLDGQAARPAHAFRFGILRFPAGSGPRSPAPLKQRQESCGLSPYDTIAEWGHRCRWPRLMPGGGWELWCMCGIWGQSPARAGVQARGSVPGTACGSVLELAADTFGITRGSVRNHSWRSGSSGADRLSTAPATAGDAQNFASRARSRTATWDSVSSPVRSTSPVT